jgi:transcriptional regulator with XRE-family HTH domain
MSIGGNIKRMRNLKKMTQKELGRAIGFDDRTADIRVAQYESGTRTPKTKMISELSRVFDVDSFALTTPDIDSFVGLMHTLFTIEDIYGLRIGEIDGEVCLRLDKHYKAFHELIDGFQLWKNEADKMNCGEISKAEYDYWRYNYPRIVAERQKQERDKRRLSKTECKQ